MAIGVLVIGESGTGKSTSIRNLNPENTAIIQAVNKPLPFKNNKLYTKENGNKFFTKDYQKVVQFLKLVDSSEKYKNIKTIILDDVTYLITDNFMTTTIKGFEKFNDIAIRFYALLECIEKLEREDLVVYLLGHQEIKENGTTGFKTIGKMIDNYIVVEGKFTIVLNTVVNNDGYFFSTQNNGYNTTKSPMGMFDTNLIENDLNLVNDSISEYFGIGLEIKKDKKNNKKGE